MSRNSSGGSLIWYVYRWSTAVIHELFLEAIDGLQRSIYWLLQFSPNFLKMDRFQQILWIHAFIILAIIPESPDYLGLVIWFSKSVPIAVVNVKRKDVVSNLLTPLGWMWIVLQLWISIYWSSKVIQLWPKSNYHYQYQYQIPTVMIYTRWLIWSTATKLGWDEYCR